MQDGVARRGEPAGVAGTGLDDEAVLKGTGQVVRVVGAQEMGGAVRLTGLQVAAQADEGGDHGGEEGAGAVQEVGVQLVDAGAGVPAPRRP